MQGPARIRSLARQWTQGSCQNWARETPWKIKALAGALRAPHRTGGSALKIEAKSKAPLPIPCAARVMEFARVCSPCRLRVGSLCGGPRGTQAARRDERISRGVSEVQRTDRASN